MKRSLIREHIFVLIFMSEFNSPQDMPEEIRLYLDSPEGRATVWVRDSSAEAVQTQRITL